MSFSLRNIREIPGDPIAKFANQLSKKLSRFLTKDQLELLDDKEDIYTDGQDLEEVIRVHDDLLSSKTFDFVTPFYPPTEPDLDKLTLWVRGRNTASNSMTDWSGFDNAVSLDRAEPFLIDGTPFDYGIHTAGVKSICQRFNAPDRETTNVEYIKVDDNSRLQVTGLVTGVSYFIRFRIHDLTVQGLERTLFEKVDDTTPNNAAMTQVTSDGKLRFIIKIGGTVYAKETSASTISTNTVYECWFTYANSGNTQHIYVNNIDETLSTYSGTVTWQSDTSNKSLFIFRRGYGSSGGYVYGDFYDFEMFREKVVSSTEVGYHYTNKWTIANIPFGQVCITDYCATYGESLSSCSFTSDSFTTDSFTICGGDGIASFTSSFTSSFTT